jgi:predicted membrane channel-forming protein YqfA (hemolysin III family)
MNWDNLPETIVALAVFGYFYNLVNEWAEREGYNDMFVGLSVAFGCLITIIGAGNVIGVEALVVVLACFAASGTSMIAGSLFRVWKREKSKRDVEKNRAGNKLEKSRRKVAEKARAEGIERDDGAGEEGCDG